MRLLYFIFLALLCLPSCRTGTVCVPDRCQQDECLNLLSLDSNETAYEAEAEQSEYLHGFPYAIRVASPEVDFHTSLNASSDPHSRIDARGCRPPPTIAFVG